MKVNNPFLLRLGGLLATAAIRGTMGSLDCKAAFYDPTVDPASSRCSQPYIYVFWHEYIMFPIYIWGGCNATMLLSQHRDGDLLASVAYHLGFECVRGSTFQGGSGALRELLRVSRSSHIAITPDGPRGPRRQMSQGPIYLSSKLRMPLVVMGYGYDRPWRMNSWDSFAVPRPLSRARTVWSPPIVLPPRLDRDGLEHYRQHVEELMLRLTSEAEAWAEAGTRKIGEIALSRMPRPKRPMDGPIEERREPRRSLRIKSASAA